MSETEMCPDCGSVRLYKRRPSIQRELTHTFRCEACTHTFDVPDTREATKSNDGSERSSELVAKLQDADPEEVGL